jgi:hypothetical protein
MQTKALERHLKDDDGDCDEEDLPRVNEAQAYLEVLLTAAIMAYASSDQRRLVFNQRE